MDTTLSTWVWRPDALAQTFTKTTNTDADASGTLYSALVSITEMLDSVDCEDCTLSTDSTDPLLSALFDITQMLDDFPVADIAADPLLSALVEISQMLDSVNCDGYSIDSSHDPLLLALVQITQMLDDYMEDSPKDDPLISALVSISEMLDAYTAEPAPRAVPLVAPASPRMGALRPPVTPPTSPIVKADPTKLAALAVEEDSMVLDDNEAEIENVLAVISDMLQDFDGATASLSACGRKEAESIEDALAEISKMLDTYTTEETGGSFTSDDIPLTRPQKRVTFEEPAETLGQSLARCMLVFGVALLLVGIVVMVRVLEAPEDTEPVAKTLESAAPKPEEPHCLWPEDPSAPIPMPPVALHMPGIGGAPC